MIVDTIRLWPEKLTIWVTIGLIVGLLLQIKANMDLMEENIESVSIDPTRETPEYIREEYQKSAKYMGAIGVITLIILVISPTPIGFAIRWLIGIGCICWIVYQSYAYIYLITIALTSIDS